ncbi:MAG: hypothetical protein ACRC2U_05020 [Aeromonas sp.]
MPIEHQPPRDIILTRVADITTATGSISANQEVRVNATAQPVTVNLTGAFPDGAEFAVGDATDAASVNDVIINPGTEKINGLTGNTYRMLDGVNRINYVRFKKKDATVGFEIIVKNEDY